MSYILEALPLDDRLTVWQLVKAERDGDILLEVSDAVRETLIADMDDHEILAAAKDLDADELASRALTYKGTCEVFKDQATIDWFTQPQNLAKYKADIYNV